MITTYHGATIIVVAKRKHLRKVGLIFSTFHPHGSNDEYYFAEVTKNGKTKTSSPRETPSGALSAGKNMVDNWYRY